MNKTLLLIIIDFLFLNLIALTQWEKLEVSRPPAPVGPEMAADPGDGPSPRDQDLVAAMQLSLADENSRREALAQKLAGTEEALAETNAALTERERNLQRLAQEKSRLDSQLTESRQTATMLSAQIQRQLAQAARDASLSKEQMERLRKELEAKRAEAERQRNDIAQLEQQQEQAREKIEGLAVAVKVAEQEKQLLKDTAETFKQQAAAERDERVKVQATTVQLAEGVGQLAEKSGELTKEIRDNRPINANQLFNEFVANRVTTSFAAYRKTFLGPINRDTDARTILITDGDKIYALMHISDTPFSLRENGADWERLKVTFAKGPNYRSPVPRLDFLSLDPRIIAVPVEQAQAAALGVKIYQTALEPFKFPEAVLINGGGYGYGEVSFKLDAGQPGYVRVDNRLMKRLFGDFAPSKGDLVFSKTGELLGIMVNNDYCAVVNNFLPAGSLETGDDITAQETGAILDAMVARYRALPLRLQ
jgi:X-X-X-Leu-X-X-Gly heptad repeat protein